MSTAKSKLLSSLHCLTRTRAHGVLRLMFKKGRDIFSSRGMQTN